MLSRRKLLSSAVTLAAGSVVAELSPVALPKSGMQLLMEGSEGGYLISPHHADMIDALLYGFRFRALSTESRLNPVTHDTEEVVIIEERIPLRRVMAMDWGNEDSFSC